MDRADLVVLVDLLPDRRLERMQEDKAVLPLAVGQEARVDPADPADPAVQAVTNRPNR